MSRNIAMSRKRRMRGLRTAVTCTTAATALLFPPALSLADDGNGPSAQELADKAEETFAKAKSVHLNLMDKSVYASASSTQPTSLDLSLDQDGNCAGSMRMGSNGGSVKIVVRDNQVWMKPDAAFWKAQVPGGQGQAAAEIFKNRYIHGSTTDILLKGMADTCDLDSFQQQATGGTGAPRTLKKGAETKVEGAKVIPLTHVEGGTTTTFYVSTDSDHHLVQATETGGDTDLALTFSDYNKPVPSATPSAAESVDITKVRNELETL